MKRFFLFLLALVLFTGTAAAQDAVVFASGDYTYTILDDGTVCLKEYFGKKTSLTIPAEIDGKPVTAIGDWAFEECGDLTSVTIPDSVRKVGANPFAGTSVSIRVSPEHPWLEVIDGVLFKKETKRLISYPCESKQSKYAIPQGTRQIGNDAFVYCERLKEITIPDSVTSIGRNAFFCCERLKTITIPDGVTTIGTNAFYGCESLTSVTIPDSVTAIGSSAFERCTKLKTITIPDGVAAIGESAFAFCGNLTEITIPASVTSIGESAFGSCTKLKTITIPDGVTSIGDRAFAYCTKLTAITIPASVTSMGDDVFAGCNRLTITDNRIQDERPAAEISYQVPKKDAASAEDRSDPAWLLAHYMKSAWNEMDSPYLTVIRRTQNGYLDDCVLAVAIYDPNTGALGILADENIVSDGCDYYWHCNGVESYEVELVSPEPVAGFVLFMLRDQEEETDIPIDIPYAAYPHAGEKMTAHYYVFDEEKQMLLAKSGTLQATECEIKDYYLVTRLGGSDPSRMEYAYAEYTYAAMNGPLQDGIVGVIVNEEGGVCGVSTAAKAGYFVCPLAPDDWEETDAVREEDKQPVTADLFRSKNGSYETGDGRFRVKVGQAMVYRDGEAYTTDAVLLRNKEKNREELQIYNFYRNESILLTVPYNSVLTGDVFDHRQIACKKDSHFDGYMESMEDFLGWTFSNQILGVCHGGDYQLCYRDGGNDFIDAAVRVLSWDTDRQEAVFYIYAAFDTAPYEYEAVAAVRMEDAQAKPAPASSTGSDREDCWICGGDGRCNKCGGSGRVREWAGDQYMDVTCTGAFCWSGKCSSCGGKGYK